jgi:putative Ca2+/H+ antiporter (TMEM165/GDT1 family)
MRAEYPLEAFLASTLAVAIAEIGDKTQLLALFLATRFASRSATGVCTAWALLT